MIPCVLHLILVTVVAVVVIVDMLVFFCSLILPRGRPTGRFPALNSQ